MKLEGTGVILDLPGRIVGDFNKEEIVIMATLPAHDFDVISRYLSADITNNRSGGKRERCARLLLAIKQDVADKKRKMLNTWRLKVREVSCLITVVKHHNLRCPP